MFKRLLRERRNGFSDTERDNVDIWLTRNLADRLEAHLEIATAYPRNTALKDWRLEVMKAISGLRSYGSDPLEKQKNKRGIALGC